MSAIPESTKYFSALLAIDLGSRLYPSPVLGSRILHLTVKVGSLKNGSITAVSTSGIRIISDSLIAFQPAIEEPSNIFPSSNKDSSTAPTGIVTCCSLPFVSVNLKSTNLTSFSFIVFIISDIIRSYVYYIIFILFFKTCIFCAMLG